GAGCRRNRNPRTHQGVRLCHRAQPSHQPRPPRARGDYRFRRRSRCHRHSRRHTRPRPHGDRARHVAPSLRRARRPAAALPRSHCAAPDRRPVAQGNRKPHGYQRKNRGRPHHDGRGSPCRPVLRRRIGAETMSAGIDTAEISTQAAHWIERRDRDEWNQADQAELDTWLNQSPAHRAAFWRLEAAWKDTNRLTAFKPSLRRSRQVRTVVSRPVFKFAAAILLVAVCGGAAALYVTTPDWKTYSTTVGGREILTLGDGTKIELNTDSAVRVAQTAHSREVWLDKGEAYFDVTHDATRPFSVTVGNRRVTDLGTKFVIRRDIDRMKVAVLDGRVQLEPKDGETKPTVLTQGDVLIATNTKLVRSRTPVWCWWR